MLQRPVQQPTSKKQSRLTKDNVSSPTSKKANKPICGQVEGKVARLDAGSLSISQVKESELNALDPMPFDVGKRLVNRADRARSVCDDTSRDEKLGVRVAETVSPRNRERACRDGRLLNAPAKPNPSYASFRFPCALTRSSEASP